MKAVAAFLRRFAWLVQLKHFVWKMLGLYRPPGLSVADALMAEVLAQHGQRQAGSIDPSHGLARGRFEGVSYALKMRPGSVIETQVLNLGVWEPHVISLMAAYLAQDAGMMVVDVGANVGATSIPLALRFPKAHFVMFEPHPAIFRDLADNCAINRLQNVELVNAAVSDRPVAELDFFAQQQSINMGLSSLRQNHDIGRFDVVKVRNLSLDAFLRESERPLGVLKVDTQGAELSVLWSAQEAIRRHRPVVFFEFESEYFPDPSEEASMRQGILTFFAASGYRLYSLHAGSNYLPALELTGYFHGDIVAVPMAAT